jgi:hypothetical protein
MYAFVVDTGAVAVFFDKAMFAHLTGRGYSTPYSFNYIEKLKEATWRKNRKTEKWLNDYFAENTVSFRSFGQSFEIRFVDRPSTYVLQLLTHRAVEFCKRGRDNVCNAMKIPFVGCRLIKTTEVQEVETIA